MEYNWGGGWGRAYTLGTYGLNWGGAYKWGASKQRFKVCQTAYGLFT